jgi:hypothetical protein
VAGGVAFGEEGAAGGTVRSYESHVRLYLVPCIGHIRLDLWVPKTCATCADAPSERRRLGPVSGTRLAGPSFVGRAMIFGLWA